MIRRYKILEKTYYPYRKKRICKTYYNDDDMLFEDRLDAIKKVVKMQEKAKNNEWQYTKYEIITVFCCE